jgi:hypothetical protein
VAVDLKTLLSVLQTRETEYAEESKKIIAVVDICIMRDQELEAH